VLTIAKVAADEVASTVVGETRGAQLMNTIFSSISCGFSFSFPGLLGSLLLLLLSIENIKMQQQHRERANWMSFIGKNARETAGVGSSTRMCGGGWQ
jgi:hypothetical protein